MLGLRTATMRTPDRITSWENIDGGTSFGMFNHHMFKATQGTLQAYLMYDHHEDLRLLLPRFRRCRCSLAAELTPHA